MKYMGHSFFTLTSEAGKTIAIDPYGDLFEYPKRSVYADTVLISHHHFDHDGVSSIGNEAEVIDQPGGFKTAGMHVEGVPTMHDEQDGTLRGKNLFFVVEAEGLRIGHAGDLGHRLSAPQLRKIGRLDVLLVPVGGTYTVDARAALEVCGQLKPGIVIPMHYRTRYNEEMTIEPLDAFLSLAGKKPQVMPLLRITKEDVGERPSLIVLDIQEA